MRGIRRGRCGRALVGALVCSAFVAGCVRPAVVPSTRYTDEVRRAMPGGTEPGRLPWFCHSEGSASGHQHGGIADPWYAGKAKGDLTWGECLAVADFFDKALASARRYPTRRDAQAAGAMQAVQHVLGTGTHDVVPGVSAWQYDEPDPEHPFYLQYDGDGPDAPLAGMSWYVVRYAPGPPAGLPGDNDWWHNHEKLCYSGVGIVIGNEIPDAECRAKGGTNVAWPYGWMLHAWIVPGYEDRKDVFAGAYGCVNAQVGPNAPADDPCHDLFLGDAH